MNEPLIQVENLLFRWQDTGPHLLDIEALSVHKKERVFIKGASGSGKSTLLSLIGGVLSPHKGQIRILGGDFSSLQNTQRDAFRADHIGFVFQMFNLIPYLSVVENVTLPCLFSKVRKKKVIERTHSLREEAVRLLAHLELQGEDILSKKVTELSMGQQQRVAAARAIIGSPDLLIADEPTSSLDADTRESFLKLLFHECDEEGITLLFVSHDGSLESLFDRSFSLSDITQDQEEQQTS